MRFGEFSSLTRHHTRPPLPPYYMFTKCDIVWPNYAGKNYKYLLAHGRSVGDDVLFARDRDGPV